MLSSPTTVVTAVAALIVVLALIWIAGRMARLTGLATRPSHAGRILMIQDSIAIDSRRRLSLVRCADRQVLILTGAGQDLVVGWVNAVPPEPRP
ncbi:MAG: hypothetical protein ACRDOE_22115 [Streptosporangiaceae bacterium]